MVKSKFSFWNVYAMYLFLAGCLAIGVVLLFHPGKQFKTKLNFTVSALWMGAGIIILVGWFLYSLLRKTIIIRVETGRLQLTGLFYNKTIEKNEIESIDLLGRRGVGLFSNNTFADAVVIKLLSGEEIVLSDFFYNNPKEIKLAVQQHLLPASLNDQYTANGSMYNETAVDTDNMQEFADNYILSFNGILFYGLAIGSIFMFANTKNASTAVIFTITFFFVMLMYFSFGSQLFYFGVSNNYLLIRNHLFFWYKRIYPMNAIKEVIIESPYKRSNSLRVITKDFTSKTYSAGSLRNKTWRALKERFVGLKIPVRSEIYI